MKRKHVKAMAGCESAEHIPMHRALRPRPLTAGLLLALIGSTCVGAVASEAAMAVSADAVTGSPAFDLRMSRDNSFLRQHVADFNAKRARALAAASSTPIQAPAVKPVTSCGDAPDDAGTLRNVIANAVSGDTIDLSALNCSTITLQPGQIAVHATDLTIVGPGQDALTIDGNHAMRPFYHYGTGHFTLRDVTVANGRHVDMNLNAAYDGGCILSLGTVVLDHSTVTSCEVGSLHAVGGAIFAYGVDMTSSTISNNSALSDNGDASGGGIFVTGSSVGYGLTMRSSAITGNQAKGQRPAGGGIMTAYAGIQMMSSVVSNNTVYSPLSSSSGMNGAVGGGLLVWTHRFGYVFNGVALSATNSTINGNSARSANSYAAGGGVYVAGEGPVSIAGSSISSNTVAGRTLGLYAGVGILTNALIGDFSTQHSIRNSTISGNVISAELAGSGDSAEAAGIKVKNGTLHLDQSTISGNRVETGQQHSAVGGISAQQLFVSNSTIAFNSALSSSGGLLVARNGDYPETRIENTIIAGNVAPVGTDVGIDNRFQTSPITVQGSHNLVSVAVADPAIVFPADTIVGDARLLPLAWNGGTTQTHALGPGSPAINAGLSSNEAYDQRGFPFLRVFDAAIDIGALEQQPPTLALGLTFSPTAISSGQSSTLTVKIFNTFPIQGALTAPFVDTLPTGLVVARPVRASTTCLGGGLTADAGGTSVRLEAGAQIPSTGTCGIAVDVTAAGTGAYTNTIPSGALSTQLGINAEAASAALEVTLGNVIFVDGFE